MDLAVLTGLVKEAHDIDKLMGAFLTASAAAASSKLPPIDSFPYSPYSSDDEITQQTGN